MEDRDQQTTKNMKITTTKETITPSKANEILTRHWKRIDDGKFVQRPMSHTVVARYAADMRNKGWLLSPQPISFDVAGDLIDGQHRLAAIKESGVSVAVMVSRGWPASNNGTASLIDVMDTGKVRSVSDMLHLHGQKYSNRFSGSARTIAIIANGGLGVGLTYQAALFILDKLDLRNAIEFMLSKTEQQSDMRAPIVAPLVWYWTVKPKKAAEFADDFFHCTAIKGSAVAAMLNWTKRTHGSRETLYGMASAIRGMEMGGDRKVIRPTVDAVKWLRDLNPKMAKEIENVAPRQITKEDQKIAITTGEDSK